jgi:FkbM family methyltransferase
MIRPSRQQDLPNLPPVSPGAIDFAELRRLIDTDAATILEIGANNGGTTLQFLEHFPACKLYAFEPDSRALFKLRSRVKDARVQIFDFAIGAEDGQAEFHVSSGKSPHVSPFEFAVEYPHGWDMSSSLRKPKTHAEVWPWVKFVSTRTINVRKLDTWAREAGIAHVDLIWADVQGAEGDLIAGGAEMLAKTRYFYTEYSDEEWYEGQPTLAALCAMLPTFEIVKRYEMDVLFKNTLL